MRSKHPLDGGSSSGLDGRCPGHRRIHRLHVWLAQAARFRRGFVQQFSQNVRASPRGRRQTVRRPRASAEAVARHATRQYGGFTESNEQHPGTLAAICYHHVRTPGLVRPAATGELAATAPAVSDLDRALLAQAGPRFPVPAERELRTLAEASDALMSGQILISMDVIGQRLRGISEWFPKPE